MQDGPVEPDGLEDSGFTAPENSCSDHASDLHIESLLASVNPADQDLGFVYLYQQKQARFFGVLRRLSDTRYWRLESHDIEDLWQETMIAIWKNVKTAKYKVTGTLDGYLFCIVERRGRDFLRRGRARIISDGDIALDLFADTRFDEPHEVIVSEVHRMLMDALDDLAICKQLSETERRVVKQYVQLLFPPHDEPLSCREPTDEELLASFDADTASTGRKNKKLTLNAVTVARRSALTKLFDMEICND